MAQARPCWCRGTPTLLAVGMAIGPGCTISASVPPMPMSGYTIADGSPGDQVYLGVGAPLPISVDVGWRHAFTKHLAMDIGGAGVMAFNGFQLGLSPGVWGMVPFDGEDGHHALAFRAGGVLGVGPAGFGGGPDGRVQYSFRWHPRGAFLITAAGQAAWTTADSFVLAVPIHTGVDVPAGSVSVHLGVTAGPWWSEDDVYLMLMGQVGVRFGTPGTGPRRSRDATARAGGR